MPMGVVVVSSVIVEAAGAPGFLEHLGASRLTIFGPLAARVAVLALWATTPCAAILLSAAFGAGRRIIALCAHVRCRMLDKGQPSSDSVTEIPYLWSGGAALPNSFAATPALAVDSGAGAFASHRWVHDAAKAAAATDEAAAITPQSVTKAAGDA